MPIYPYSFQLPPLNVQDIPNDGVPGEFLGISAGGVLDWLPVVAGGGGDMLKSENLSGLANFATARTNIGLGTASTPTFANLTLTSPSLSSSAPVTISQTWNGTGSTVFTALKVNATTPGTTSSSSSLLLDLQVGGVSQLNVRKNGQALFSSGIVSAPGITFLSGSNTGIWETSAGVQFSSAGTNVFGVRNEIRVNGSLAFGFASGTPADTALDVALWRDAPNTLALRNGAAAQTFNVYGTYTSLTDYKRLSLSCSASTGNATIGVPFNSVLAVTGGSATATVATVTFAAQAAAFPVGSSVTVTGVTPAGYNVTAVVTASTTTSVSYASTVNAAYVSGGTATISGSAALTLTAAGNVGIGTTAPTAPLEIRGTAVADIREPLLKCTVSDAGNDAFHVFNATSANNRFIPGFSGSVFANVGSLVFSGQTTAASDNGIVPLTLYVGRLTSSETDPNNGTLTTVSTRPLFGWYNHTTSLMQMAANGNLGIGTTSPSSKLDVAGAVTAAGYFTATSGGVSLVANGLWQQGTGHLTLASGAILGWSGQANVNIDQPGDTRLLREEAYHLATRNGTNGQKFSVYGTYPGAAWERFTITAPTSGNVLLGTYKGTGGIARGLEFQTDGVTRMTLGTTEITTTVPFTASGLGKFVGIQLGTSGSSRLVSPGYGIATFLDSDGTGNFTKLNLAGNTDSFPSLKRSTTRIQAVLATTDTTFTNIQGKLTTDTDFTATTIVPTGFLTLYDAQGTAYRVPCVPA